MIIFERLRLNSNRIHLYFTLISRLLLAVQSQVWRSTGINIRSNRIRRPDFELPLLTGRVIIALLTQAG